MKMNIKGLVFVGFAAAVFASAANAALPGEADQPKTVTSVKFTEATYQKKLNPGNFVAIDPSTNTITTTYSEGNGIDISNTGVISVDQAQLTNYAAGTNVTFTQGAAGTENEGKTVISATDTTYNAFNGSADGLVPSEGAAAGKVLSGNGNWIEVDGTAYSAGQGIDITQHTVTNTGVRGVTATPSTGTNGTITVDTNGSSTEVAVKGLQDAAYLGKDESIDSNSTHNDAATAKAVYDFVTDQIQDAAYEEGNNVYFTTDATTNKTEINSPTIKLNGTAVAPNGNHEILLTNTEYTADNTTVEIDANSNNQIKAKTAAITGTSQQTLTTGGQVYDFVTGLIPASLPSTCNAQAPCALVLAGSTPTWQPIQQ